MSDVATREQVESAGTSPVEYMKREGALVPGIVAIDPTNLLVSHVDGMPQDARPITEEQLTDPERGVLYCSAPEGRSLDESTKAVFLFDL